MDRRTYIKRTYALTSIMRQVYITFKTENPSRYEKSYTQNNNMIIKLQKLIIEYLYGLNLASYLLTCSQCKEEEVISPTKKTVFRFQHYVYLCSGTISHNNFKCFFKTDKEQYFLGCQILSLQWTYLIIREFSLGYLLYFIHGG